VEGLNTEHTIDHSRLSSAAATLHSVQDSPQPFANDDLQNIVYQAVALSQLPKEQAVEFCQGLYSPEERFAKGFYRYWKDVLNMTDEEALAATHRELETYTQGMLDNLDDPYFQTIGFNQQGTYIPVSIYSLRPLESHATGSKLLQGLQESGHIKHYPGNLAIAHSFSTLSGYRTRFLMKYAFTLIAIEALAKNYNYIFFFMSDHRLGPIYQRYGLEFPPELKIPDSQHLVGYYSISPKRYAEIYEATQQFKHCLSEEVLEMVEKRCLS
jgi:hypothetical protein